MTLGITVLACNISNNIIKRFKYYVEQNKPKKIDYQIEIVNDKKECIVIKDNKEFMCRSKGLNIGIKRLVEKDCDVIVCTDIDMMIPPNLLQYIYDVLNKVNNVFIWVPCRNINFTKFKKYKDWNKLLNLSMRSVGKGSFNAANINTWYKLGGWNEKLYGYGGADDDLHIRAKHLGIKMEVIKDFPLMHINHPSRYRNQQNRIGGNGPNMKIAKQMIQNNDFPQWLK